MRRTRHVVVAILGWTTFAAGAATGQTIERISVASDGTPGNGDSSGASVSDDGGRVAFASYATNLVIGDTNNALDIFLRDRAAATTQRVSVSSSGVQANDLSYSPRISADGLFVVFVSKATNLVSNDANHALDVFVREIATSTTTRVSVSSSNIAANGDSFEPAVSGDGRYVAFASDATNLVSGDKNRRRDVFLRDRTAGTTTRISVATNGTEANGDSEYAAISRDGRYVVFTSNATNLDPADALSDGDVYLRDTVLGTTTLISISSTGVKGDAASGGAVISDDGRYVAFASLADNFVAGDHFATMDVFVRDRTAGTTICVSVDSDGVIDSSGSYAPAISSDGSSVFFDSAGDTLVDSDLNGAVDLFCHFDPLALTTRQSVAADGEEADLGISGWLPNCSGDAHFVAFTSKSTNLVSGGGVVDDVYLRERPMAIASWQDYGTGVAGTHGVPALTASAPPQLNQTIDLVVGNSWHKWTTALIVLGLQQVQWPTSWGGDLLVNPIETLFVALPPGGMTLTDQVPPDEFLCGVVEYGQVLEIDPGAIQGISFSQGIALGFGY